jgi:hypothetical protein
MAQFCRRPQFEPAHLQQCPAFSWSRPYIETELQISALFCLLIHFDPPNGVWDSGHAHRQTVNILRWWHLSTFITVTLAYLLIRGFCDQSWTVRIVLASFLRIMNFSPIELNTQLPEFHHLWIEVRLQSCREWELNRSLHLLPTISR